MRQRISLGCPSTAKETKYLFKFIEKFNSWCNSVEIIPQFIDTTEIFNTTSDTLLLPDIIVIHSSDIDLFLQKDLILPLGSIFSPSEMEDIYPAILSSVKQGEEILGLPLIEGNPWCILYNYSIFHDARIKEPPKSWGELFEFAEKMTKDKDKDGLIDQWGLSLPLSSLYLFIWQNEGDILDEIGKPLFNEKTEETISYLIKLKKFLSPHQDIEKGDTGMIYTRDILITDSYGVSFIPTNLRKANSFGGENGVVCFSVVKKQKNITDAVFEFLQWWKKDENYLEWCITTDFIPLKKSIIETDKYQEYLREKPYLKVQLIESEICRVIDTFSAREVAKLLVKIVEEVEDEGIETEEVIRMRLKEVENLANHLTNKYPKR